MPLGELLMIGFHGTDVDEHVTRMIRDHRVGAIILFRRNLASPRQVAKLTDRLQQLNAEVCDLPLLVALDQEGDMVPRFDTGLTPLPSALLYKQQGLRESCEALHRVTASELRAIGINFNLSPCLDINSNRRNPVIGVRSFGETATDVIDYGMAAMRGLRAGGLLVSAKHFPGHGDTVADSHHGLPLIPHDLRRLTECELAPFKAAVAAGVDAIMTAHVCLPAIDPDGLPATLSRSTLTGLLRESLGYTGAILTDCLEMAAVLERFGIERAAPMAIRASADIVSANDWRTQVWAAEAHERSKLERLVRCITRPAISEVNTT